MSLLIRNSLLKWDIFCRVIDNFGDVGVCWRLARVLASRYSAHVRLWVDDWATLARLCPEADCDGRQVSGVEFRHWVSPFPAVEPAEVVVESFACELPALYVQAMAARPVPPVWINLDYLSAENWVREAHGLPSPHPRLPLVKYFFFPGFWEETGGLVREDALFERRERFLETHGQGWRKFGIDPPHGNVLAISLFSYAQQALPELLHCWQGSERPVLLLVPEGRALEEAGAALGIRLEPGMQARRGVLCVKALPFMSQDGYDELLWSCHLNFVRGEDSFVRAQWAAKPFIWHIYPQKQDAHLAKLEAFLALYCAGLGEEAALALTAFWRAWNRGENLSSSWRRFAEALPELKQHAKKWCSTLASRPCLATKLWQFCQHVAKNISC
ncbi:MAG: elongation factor P maturation arginine rhamnosyltransferase EarP [Azoarcus sp.]|jgi:uncharacterized repeat protein (TIGR03837 family)|nr:elongation factor P maturation arginine rhamnosyltransferase EarP [Azoarcus sp.]